MGYESKVYVVDTYGRKGRDKDGEKRFCAKVAEFNLGSIPAIYDVLCKEVSDFFVYESDGDTPILKDKYNKELTQCSLETLINAIENSSDCMEYYKTKALLGFLKICNTSHDVDDLICLHYGY